MTIEVEIQAGQGVFEGLAKQNLEFHQCICELVDNGIAAAGENHPFTIEIGLERDEEDAEIIDVWIADNCGGMDLETFQDALQLGRPATTEHRLNEHGFGMKNALATLSGNNNWWKVWTKTADSESTYSATGPFERVMEIDDEEELPTEDFIPGDVSTVVRVPVQLSFVQTVQGRGSPAKNLTTLRQWLIEHLGVAYRGFLGVDPGDSFGSISVTIGTDRKSVPPIPVPIANSTTKHLEVELGGEVYDITYEFGTLDEHRTESLVDGQRTKAYYLGNQATQGVDIRLGNRTIATSQLSNIWMERSRESRLQSHVRFNHFVGEIRIPGDVPRGLLTTTNSKTDFNLDDDGWQKIFHILNEDDDLRPLANSQSQTESQLKEQWMDMLSNTRPEDEVTDERSVWPPGAQIDVLQATDDGRHIIYELKTGTGSPRDLYQLKMYWDGLAIEGIDPHQGILFVENYGTNLEEMANKINSELTSPGSNDNYNLIIQKHEDRGLDSSP